MLDFKEFFPMRNEKEMIDLILRYASDHEGIRAVVMNGSRVNPKVIPDQYQDFDVIYFVQEVAPFIRNTSLVIYFGEPMIIKYPDDRGDPPRVGDGSYQYLMQFMDGNRIDLSIEPLSHIKLCVKDSLTKVMLDKDGLIGILSEPSEDSYLPTKPTQKQFNDCCNEFWWRNPYLAKALIRDQLPYAKYVFDTTMRDELMKMLTWYAGIRTNYKVSVGLFGKYLNKQIEPNLWHLLERTYADHHEASTWKALFEMQELFRIAAIEVSSVFGFEYPDKDDKKVASYINKMRKESKKGTPNKSLQLSAKVQL
jgi:aminoglycoside 6-adenylyltransferase